MEHCLTHTPPPRPPVALGPRGCSEKEENNSHLEFSPSSYALLVLSLLGLGFSEMVVLTEKSFPHIEKLIPSCEELFVIRAFFPEGRRSALSIPGKLIHPIFRIQ